MSFFYAFIVIQIFIRISSDFLFKPLRSAIFFTPISLIITKSSIYRLRISPMAFMLKNQNLLSNKIGNNSGTISISMSSRFFIYFTLGYIKGNNKIYNFIFFYSDNYKSEAPFPTDPFRY